MNFRSGVAGIRFTALRKEIDQIKVDILKMSFYSEPSEQADSKQQTGHQYDRLCCGRAGGHS